MLQAVYLAVNRDLENFRSISRLTLGLSGANTHRRSLGDWVARVVTYFVQTNCLEITMAWKTSSKDVATRVGRFALHIIFWLVLGAVVCCPRTPLK